MSHVEELSTEKADSISPFGQGNLSLLRSTNVCIKLKAGAVLCFGRLIEEGAQTELTLVFLTDFSFIFFYCIAVRAYKNFCRFTVDNYSFAVAYLFTDFFKADNGWNSVVAGKNYHVGRNTAFAQGKACNLSFAQDDCVGRAQRGSHNHRAIWNCVDIKWMNVQHFVQDAAKNISNILGTFRKVVVTGLSQLCGIFFCLKLHGIFYVKEFFFVELASFLLKNRVFEHKNVGLKNLALGTVTFAGFGK